eukprot:TRINITY_DN9393_c0_g1_i1.p1 TRINITY_DN9393_c0_g1~~TRINITY_DN9393_c0_g1_i1.p1  ORF type:complete len:341 (+),score=52.53 TRINITY_DN9393_c0_g1_i1:85-1023(+)
MNSRLLTEGCLVKLHALSREELNGEVGGVVSCQGAARLIVALKGDRKLALKLENLEPVISYQVFTFILNSLSLIASFGYIAVSVFNPWSNLGFLLWKLALSLHVINYGSICWNIGLLALKKDSLTSLAGNRAGQVLLWCIAFLFLGESCYFLLAALGCYSIVSLARSHEPVIPKFYPFVFLAHLLDKVDKGLVATEHAMVEYDKRDWTGDAVRPTPPAHPLEIAGVIFELFVGVQQFFQIVLSATQSFIMFVLCWRYLGYRYRTPENRTVRTVFNKAREQLNGYFQSFFVPTFVSETYLWGTEKLWGPPVVP